MKPRRISPSRSCSSPFKRKNSSLRFMQFHSTQTCRLHIPYWVVYGGDFASGELWAFVASKSFALVTGWAALSTGHHSHSEPKGSRPFAGSPTRAPSRRRFSPFDEHSQGHRISFGEDAKRWELISTTNAHSATRLAEYDGIMNMTNPIKEHKITFIRCDLKQFTMTLYKHADAPSTIHLSAVCLFVHCYKCII